MTQQPVYSVVLPLYNEEANLPVLYDRLTAVMQRLGQTYEILFVDDGSSDASVAIVRQLNARDPQIKLVKLSRNFGHQLAVSAALDHVEGDAVVVIDGDLQDPPEVIPELVAKWKEGFDVVYAQRRSRQGETWFKKSTAKLFYRLLRFITNIDIPLDTGDFALMDKKVVSVLKQMPERSRFIRGMRAWTGYPATGVLYDRQERVAGSSKYTLRKMVKFATTGILAFSVAPLRIAIHLGLFMAFCSFVATIAVIVLKLTTGLLVQGWASLMLAVIFIGGIQLFIMGMLGEYIGHIYDEVRRRPLYVIREYHGIDVRARS